MRKNLFIIGALSLGVIFTACSSSVSEEGLLDPVTKKIEKVDVTNFETIKINNLYSMAIPNVMSSSTTLNADASLQYNYLYKDQYVIVLDENKQEFVEVFEELGLYNDDVTVIENYAEQQFNLMSAGTIIQSQTPMESMKVNGMNAIGKNFDADADGISQTVSYFYGFVEGDEHLYMIMAWTLKTGKENYVDDVEKMINSFKEL